MNIHHFETGAIRENKEGRGRYDLPPHEDLLKVWNYAKKQGYTDAQIIETFTAALPRIAKRYEEGAKVHGDHNWTKGMEIGTYVSSMWRHLLEYGAGHTDEDHLSALVWNALSALWTEDNLPDMIDMPTRKRAHENSGIRK